MNRFRLSYVTLFAIGLCLSPAMAQQDCAPAGGGAPAPAGGIGGAGLGRGAVLRRVPMQVRPIRGWSVLKSNKADSESESADVKPKPEPVAQADTKAPPQLLAVVLSVRSSYDATEYGPALGYMTHRALRGMPGVLVYNGQAHQLTSQYQVSVGKTHSPALLVFGPDGKQLVKVTPDTPRREADEALILLGQVNAWMRSVPGRLTKAERTAAAGQFRTALKSVAAIAKEDARVNDVLARLTGTAQIKANPSLAVEGATGRFFPDVEKTYHAKFEEMAAARVAKARELLAKGEFAQARAALGTMARYPGDLPSLKQAADLLEQIKTRQAAAIQAAAR